MISAMPALAFRCTLQRKPRFRPLCCHLEPGTDQAGDIEDVGEGVELVDRGGVLETEPFAHARALKARRQLAVRVRIT